MPSVAQRIDAYLSGGGLFNPELADHAAVRALLLDCRQEIEAKNIVLSAALMHRDFVIEQRDKARASLRKIRRKPNTKLTAPKDAVE